MSTYTSGSIYFSGLGTDTDWNSMIDQLLSIEQTTAKRLAKWKSDWQTRINAFQQVRAAIVNMQTALTAINTPDKFLTKTAAVSGSSVSVTAGNGAVAGNYSVGVNQLATTSIWNKGTGLAAKSDVVNSSGSMGSFTYSYKGESYSVDVPAGTTLEGLKNILNNSSKNPGVKVQLIQAGDEVVFQMNGMDQGSGAVLTIDSTTNLNGLEVNATPTWSAGTSSMTMVQSYASGSTVLNNTETDKSFVFTVNGQKTTVKLQAGGTLDDLVAAINDKTGTSGVSASLVANGSEYSLQLNAGSGIALGVNGGTLEGFSGRDTVSNWQVQYGQDAEIRVNGWPQAGWLTVSSNTVDDVVEGLTINLRSVGYSDISVELDTEAIEASVQKFIDSINEVRTLLLSLTEVSDSKTTLDPEYADSQFEMQSGSTLTGNYGIQLLSSNLKMAVAGKALGFNYAVCGSNGNIESGDRYSTLSQIGITTNATKGHVNFGLLEITLPNYGSSGNILDDGAITLAQALADDPEAVARLFSSVSEGYCESEYFNYNSHIVSITKPGTYEVSYSTDSNGDIVSAFINGQTATIDNTKRQIGLYDNDNDAGGILLDVYSLAPNSSYNGNISIRQGKVNQILDMLSGTEGILGEDGVLNILESNYNDIIKNIDDKIAKEDARLEKWERTMRNKFARLEATLGTYENIMSQLESQIKSLNSNSSS